MHKISMKYKIYFKPLSIFNLQYVDNDMNVFSRIKYIDELIYLFKTELKNYVEYCRLYIDHCKILERMKYLKETDFYCKGIKDEH